MTAVKGHTARVPGHALVGEGISQFLSTTCAEAVCAEYAARARAGDALRNETAADRFAGGHAKCSCGLQSPHLSSQGARRRWHRKHKAEVVAS